MKENASDNQFSLTCYLESSRVDREGIIHTTFQFRGQQSVEHAKLILISRDFKNYLPVLLDMTIKRAKNYKLTDEERPTKIQKYKSAK